MFYTIGYEGLGIARFLELLTGNGVQTLLDTRQNPVSRNPDFHKDALGRRLADIRIAYVHLGELGIPSSVRKAGNALEWYAENVRPKIAPAILDEYKQPVCFMCMERDINCCHRKIIRDALVAQGLEGRELAG